MSLKIYIYISPRVLSAAGSGDWYLCSWHGQWGK